VVGLEIEDGTITHLLTKPLPRQEIVWPSSPWPGPCASPRPPSPIAAAARSPARPAWRLGLGLGAAVSALAYSAVFLALSLVTRRPVAVGLVYIILWENLLTRFVDGTRVLSIRQYAASLTNASWLPTHLAPVTPRSWPFSSPSPRPSPPPPALPLLLPVRRDELTDLSRLRPSRRVRADRDRNARLNTALPDGTSITSSS
jgi:hypothetical protein